MIWRFYTFSILAGLCAGWVASLLGMIVAFGVLIVAGSPEAVDEALVSTDVQMAILLPSVVSSLVAGYFAARSAPGEELLNACATGAILALGVASFVRSPTITLPGWVNALSLALTFFFAAAGGLFYLRRSSAV